MLWKIAASGLGVIQQGLQERQHLFRTVGALRQHCQLRLQRLKTLPVLCSQDGQKGFEIGGGIFHENA
jgi:hypothetical protein